MGDPQPPQGGLRMEPVFGAKTFDWQAFKSPLGDLGVKKDGLPFNSGVKQKMDSLKSPLGDLGVKKDGLPFNSGVKQKMDSLKSPLGDLGVKKDGLPFNSGVKQKMDSLMSPLGDLGVKKDGDLNSNRTVLKLKMTTSNHIITY